MSVDKQAIYSEFNGRNHRQLTDKYGISYQSLIRIIRANRPNEDKPAAIKALRGALADVLSHQDLSVYQLETLIPRACELGAIDIVQQLLVLRLNADKFCDDAQGHHHTAPKLRLALTILGFLAALQGLILRFLRRLSY